MPKVDMVMDTGTFVEWMKQEGEEVQKGEPLFVILTDKANIQIEAPANGVLAGVRARPDDVIPVTEVIAYILEPGEALPDVAQPEPTVETAVIAKDPLASGAAIPEVTPSVTRETLIGKVRATPTARRLASQLAVDLTNLSGRGPRGRIHKADVLAAAEQQPASAAQATVPASMLMMPSSRVPFPTPETRQKAVIPLTGPRKVIAQRLSYSASTVPHINLSLRVDMSESARLRDQVQESIQQKTGHSLSFTAIIARAVASVLPRHPYLNASLQEDKIIVWHDVHLGIATSLEDYLIVPVIREAQTKRLEDIVTGLADLVERARAKRLTPAEMTGSTFTISNLGMFGIEQFTAIINPPEAGILAVGAIVESPVSTEDGIKLRPMMNLTLCVDHRVVDGAAGARFFADLKSTLENPYLLI
jgi:pyruvate dehydrogenase E2 component (dihydrolipoamide acetyltransferase)